MDILIDNGECLKNSSMIISQTFKHIGIKEEGESLTILLQ